MIALLMSAAVAAATPAPVTIAQALAAPDRGAQASADARRHPGEILTFAGVKPGQKVVDLIPGGGYFTRLFSKVVGPNGKVYAVWPNEYAKEAGPEPAGSESLHTTAGYENVVALRQPAAAFATPEPVDLVFTAQNYHDYPDKFMGPADLAAFDAQVFRALKKGGVFLIVDHVAAAGSGTRDTDTLHRIDPETVKTQVTAAGFRYAGELGVLRNPADDHSKTVFDKAIRGKTDQFVMKFMKP